MKTFWSVISILAVAHIFALASVVGYLAMTDRLNVPRIREIRTILSTTVADEQALAQAEQVQAQAELAQAQRDANLDEANPGVELRNELFHTLDQTQQEIIRRAQRDLDGLINMLNRRLAEVEKREADLANAQAVFEARFGAARTAAAIEQFDKMVALISGLKAEDIKTKFDVYLNDGKIDLVIDILNAMPPRDASKVLALYQSQPENIVAADLLLQLKNQGLELIQETATDEQRTASANPAN